MREGGGREPEVRTPPFVTWPDREAAYWPSSAASRASMARAPESELAIE